MPRSDEAAENRRIHRVSRELLRRQPARDPRRIHARQDVLPCAPAVGSPPPSLPHVPGPLARRPPSARLTLYPLARRPPSARLTLCSLALRHIRALPTHAARGAVCHFMGCFWYGITILEPTELTWRATYADGTLIHDDSSTARAYFFAIYWAMTTMTTVGYGDMTPTSTTQEELEHGSSNTGARTRELKHGSSNTGAQTRELEHRSSNTGLAEVPHPPCAPKPGPVVVLGPRVDSQRRGRIRHVDDACLGPRLRLQCAPAKTRVCPPIAQTHCPPPERPDASPAHSHRP